MLIAKPGIDSKAMWLVVLAAMSVFYLDCLTRLGVAIPFFYILILWVTLVRAPRHALAVTAASSTLTVIGVFLSPEGELHTDLTNRAITLVVLWFLAYFGIAHRKALNTHEERERELTDFFENAPVGIHWSDSDGNILGVNQQELDMRASQEPRVPLAPQRRVSTACPYFMQCLPEERPLHP